MKLNVKKKLEDNKYSVDITFKEYGRLDLTSDEEKEILKNYSTSIRYKDIKFEGYFKVDSNGKVVEATDDTDGELVKISLNDMIKELNEKFSAYFDIELKRINDSEVGTILNSKYLVAEAKGNLFENKIKEAINKEIDRVVALNNSWEDEYDITL